MRRRSLLSCFLVFAGCISIVAQIPATPPPQSARQALIEMFMGKGADDFQKHLPDLTRQTLIHKGETPETSIVMRIAAMGRQMAAPGAHVETFDVGPNILIIEPTAHEKIEIAVERDSFMGEEDEIELSLHSYKDGQPEFIPVIPRLTFTLRQDKEIWRLTEITLAAHVPLTDPDYLKGVRKEQNDEYERMAQAHVAGLAAEETAYAAKHPERGYACTLPGLLTPDPSTDSQAGGFVDPLVKNSESNGYRFAIAGCDGTPAAKYQLTGVPTDPDPEMKTFCVDESGTVKFVTGGKSSSCFTRGQPANQGQTEGAITVD